MYSKTAAVKNQVGLHARPATFFIQKANEFKSNIWVEKDERRVNAKSLLGVLSMGITRPRPDKLSAICPICGLFLRTARSLFVCGVPAEVIKDGRFPQNP